MDRTARASSPDIRARSSDLVARAKRGDREAFGRLVQMHQRAVLDTARRFLPEDDARDVAQRTFVCAYENLYTFRGEAGFRSWLRRIAHNVALNHVRERRRLDPLDDAADPKARPSITGLMMLAELRERLSRAVRQLPPKQRLVVELRIFRDQSFRDIARIADCTEDSAKANFHHAAKQLRQWLS